VGCWACSSSAEHRSIAGISYLSSFSQARTSLSAPRACQSQLQHDLYQFHPEVGCSGLSRRNSRAWRPQCWPGSRGRGHPSSRQSLARWRRTARCVSCRSGSSCCPCSAIHCQLDPCRWKSLGLRCHDAVCQHPGTRHQRSRKNWMKTIACAQACSTQGLPGHRMPPSAPSSNLCHQEASTSPHDCLCSSASHSDPAGR